MLTPREIKLREVHNSIKRSPLYPQFLGMEGPAERLDPKDTTALEFLQLLWPSHLFELIALETNNYAKQKKYPHWTDTTTEEIRAFLGVIICMGFHCLPSLADYWSSSRYKGVPAIQEHMTYSRFRDIWKNIHLVDNKHLDENDRLCKVRPIIRCLNDTFPKNYYPSQEMSVDEAMIKCKGRAQGKVSAPRKPVKRGFKVWCCSCSCCGYLCTFSVYSGRPNSGTPQKVSDVVKDLLLDLYTGENHVVYMDRYFTSGPLVKELEQHQIYTVGTIRRNADGVPDELKAVTPAKGAYFGCTSDGVSYFVFNDRSLVCFVTNVFPLTSETVFRVQKSGLLEQQSVPPLLPAYNMFMGGVDRTNQRYQYYAFDHKCIRPWMRIFFHLFDLAINNAYILYSHNCRTVGARAASSLNFREQLVHSLLEGFCSRKRGRTVPRYVDDADFENHQLVSVRDVHLKRGRCKYCLTSGGNHHTSFACSSCKVRLCKTDCFFKYHRNV